MIKSTATAAAMIAAAVLTAAPSTAGDQHRNWAPCEYEDGSSQKRCIWDARHMGNGQGTSAKIFNGGEDDMRIVRISHRKAHHLITQH